ncbi:hypothetical protein ACH47Z_39110 [Streptomyces sp. NPDC020192]|uniref:hypothetical protein n=1 Tax=Streptomyces sp. NPDC020192 TaxID=3365066 RepID=UPI003788DF3E
MSVSEPRRKRSIWSGPTGPSKLSGSARETARRTQAARLRPATPAVALNGTDHKSHDEQNAAINAYVRWRNGHAEPKTGFAPDSPIRSWTQYPAKAA